MFFVPIPEIQIGTNACLTLFDPSAEYLFDRKSIRSISENTPYSGQPMKGKVIGIINGNKTYLN